ncbi:MAG TPA: response regulator transcription factor [Candidatus Dormibacteraeota bacterium]|nr:response regulator transcription factor [Candidatus Dormibacteraeota bacterium]
MTSFVPDASRVHSNLVDISLVNQASVNPVRVLVVQDHPLLASAIARVLDSEEDMTVVGIARRGEEAATLAAEQKPAVVLMDFRLPDLTGPAAAAKIRTAVPSAAIVFHSAEESEDALLDAIDAGAIAYLTKSATADEIIEAVRKASVGEVLIPVGLFAKAIARQRRVGNEKQAREKLLAEFTPRELDVLRLLADGHDTQALARLLGIAPHTVEWHVTHVIEKLRVHSKLQAVIAAARLGLIEI